MTRKRKLIIAAVALTVVAAAFIIYYTIPIPLTDSPSELDIWEVSRFEDGEEIFVTPYVSESALSFLLSEITYTRFPVSDRDSFWTETLRCRLHFLVGEYPDTYTITVHDDGVFLHTRRGFTYRVNDAERFAERIAAIIG